MERLNTVEFERAIDRHLLWRETGHLYGEPAVFRDYFIDSDFINTKTRNLSEVMFENCKFEPQLFMNTKFDKTIFQRCILYGCVFGECTFTATEFQWCNMSHTYFMADHPSLFSPSFLHTSLYEAGFAGCDLSRASFDAESKFFLLPRCPEGSFIAYKIAQNKIVKLRIPSDAKRSNATTNKCRGSKAEVLAIENLDGTPAEVTEVSSDFDDDFIYRIGETVSVPDFDEDRWNECSSGIHFFLSREEAANYGK